MSRKQKTTAIILAISMAATAYMAYIALKGLSDALEDHAWDIDE